MNPGNCRWAARSALVGLSLVALAARLDGQETDGAAPPADKTSTAVQPATPLPASAPVALGGYSPTAYLLEGKAVKGDPAVKSSYQGETYYHATQEAKKQFDADPVKFLPQFGGLCATALGGNYGNRFLGEPGVFTVHEGKVYLFSSERAKRAFDNGPASFVIVGTEVFNRPFLDGNCLVSYQREYTTIKGDPGKPIQYRQFVLYFASDEKRDAFRADPEKYFPRYDGYCAKGVSEGKAYPADPSAFVVYNGQTYMFLNEESRQAFIRMPEFTISTANAKWPDVRLVALTPRSNRR